MLPNDSWRNHPQLARRKPPLDLILERCKRDANGCLIWLGGTNSDGYGMIMIDYVSYLVHRLAYELRHGALPSDIFVCHSCDVPQCVEDAHHFPGTNQINQLDARAKGKLCPPKGERHHAAILSDQDVVAIRQAQGFQHEIANQFGISQSLVSLIKNGRHRA